MAAHSGWGAEELTQLFPLGIWVGTEYGLLSEPRDPEWRWEMSQLAEPRSGLPVRQLFRVWIPRVSASSRGLVDLWTLCVFALCTPGVSTLCSGSMDPGPGVSQPLNPNLTMTAP